MILMPELCYYCREELNFGDMTLHDGHRVHKRCLPQMSDKNEWDDAARKAAEDVNVVCNDIDYRRGEVNWTKEEVHEIITKHHADIRATYEKLCQVAMATKAHIQADGNEGIFVVEELLNDPLVVAAIERRKGV